MSREETRMPSSPFVIVGRVAGRLADAQFPTGVHATLRRLDPRSPGRAVTALERVKAEVDQGDTEVWRGREEPWALVIHCLALTRGRHDKDISTGRALHALPLTELRLNQLLAAEHDVLFDLLPSLARRVDAHGVALNWGPLAMLALSKDTASGDKYRLIIARDYARASGLGDKDSP